MSKKMNEKIKVRFTVPETLAESANRFLKSLAYPTQKPGGHLAPPPRISVERGSDPIGGYVVESLKIRPLEGVDESGPSSVTVVEVVAVPISKYIYTGPRGENKWVPCPECSGCGVGNTPGALACEDVCTRCAGKGRVRKDELGPMGFKGDIENGPVDESVKVENEEVFEGEFGDGKTFSSDEGKQELKRRILDRMTAVDMVDAISNGCDLPNLADIIIDLYPPEEILEMTPKEGPCPERKGTGKVPKNEAE